MSRELRVIFSDTSAGTPYCIIRRKSDSYVWDGSGFVVWADGDVATYEVSLSDRAGDLWSGDHPAAIAVGTYIYAFYYRTGASATADDEPLRSYTKFWNGATLESESEITLSAYALTTLESVKRRLEIDDSESDTILSEYINQVSGLIEHVTGRKFKARDYRWWLNGLDQRELTLPVYPIQRVTRIAFGAGNAFSLTFGGSGIRASASIYRDPESPDAGGLRIVSVSSTGVPTENNLSFATYRSVTALETAVEAVSGWAMTVQNNVPTLDLHPGIGGDCLSRLVTFTWPDRDEYDYSYDAEVGTIRFNKFGSGVWGWWGYGRGGHHDMGVSGWRQPPTMPNHFQGVLVEARGGYETIPADVSLVCNELVQDKFYEGQIGIGVHQQVLGPARLVFDKGDTDLIADRLTRYIDHSRLVGGIR